MAIYTISYDLIAPGKDYTSLFEAIKRIANGYYRPLKSLWLIGHPGSASTIRDALTPHIDRNDKLLVMKASPDWASYGIDADWLKQHVSG